MFIKTKDKVFDASCDPTKLTTVIKIFLDEIIPNHADLTIYYEVFIPLQGAPTQVWRPINAKMLTEDILEIMDIDYKDIKTKFLDDIAFNKDDIFSYTTKYSVGCKPLFQISQKY